MKDNSSLPSASPLTTEKAQSQIPAIAQLINLGYQWLSPADCLRERDGKTRSLLLHKVLRRKLPMINRICSRGKEYAFSDENIELAIKQLNDTRFDGLQKTNEAIYEKLTLGTTLSQLVNDNRRSFPLRYIDWEHWENNDFNVTAEYDVSKQRSSERATLDIVLFVNGIPFAVIECKAPSVDVSEGISQVIDYQRDRWIPHFFSFVQLVVATNKNTVKYATAGTPARFWALWKESLDNDSAVLDSINTPLKPSQKETLFTGPFKQPELRDWFETLTEQARTLTEQDKNLYSLCRPERLLEIAFRFTVFDGGMKKIARYQQYFVTKATLKRIAHKQPDGKRDGGIVWHTQGSGKSLTMVMLTRNILLDSQSGRGIRHPRIVLVTDRTNLDRQLGNTFRACQLSAKQATSGKHLLKLISEEKAELITTLVHKFDKALNVRRFKETSADIIVLIDEGHRSQYKNLAARMNQMLPNACYLGFTGTPLTQKEKNTFSRIGKLIQPVYTIEQAVNDGAVVPLLYEGRHVEMEQNKQAVDNWFERHTQGLTAAQKADLKRKYARAEMLNRAEQVVYMRAFDISEHFREHWQGTGFKAQLVAPRRDIALLYKRFLDDIGYVSSEVVISAPDKHEDITSTEEDCNDDVVTFWERMMKRYGSAEQYEDAIVNQFKHAPHPEILIVVSKLLTGFDAPANTVLYLCRNLKEHTLLQAIARVNRLYSVDMPVENNEDDSKTIVTVEKEFGYIIDYASILEELDQALHHYNALNNYDEADISGTMIRLNEEVSRLPQRYSDVWELFNTVKNRQDVEAYERLLADRQLRDDFYERLCQYGKTLSIALSSAQFITNTSDDKLDRYKADMLFFSKLRQSVKLRYCDSIDYRDYEPKIKKLLDTHIQASEVTQLNNPVNIFDQDAFGHVKAGQGLSDNRSTAAKADAIAHRTIKRINEKMGEDDVFYRRFSQLIQQAIDDFREQRLSEQAYFETVKTLAEKMDSNIRDDIPVILNNHTHAQAYFGVFQLMLETSCHDNKEAVMADAAIAIESLFSHHAKVGFWDDEDAQKQVANAIDDYLFDELKDNQGIDLPFEQMDEIIAKIMQIARRRMTL